MVNRIKILLVDDDEEDLILITEVLRKINNNAVLETAEDGKIALEKLEADEKEGLLPHLVVLDLNMPQLNGTETLKLIKSHSRFRHIPVIIFSTSINNLEKNKCISLGAYAYMTKPLSLTEAYETGKYFLETATQSLPS